MPKILANGINLHYLQVGCGPDIVMLHGLTGNLAIWHLKIVRQLQAQFRVTTYDLLHLELNTASNGVSPDLSC